MGYQIKASPFTTSVTEQPYPDNGVALPAEFGRLPFEENWHSKTLTKTALWQL